MAWDEGGGDWAGDAGVEGRSPDMDTASRNYEAMGNAYRNWMGQKPTVEGAGWSWRDLAKGSGNAAMKLGKYVRDYQAWEKQAPYGSRAPSRSGGFGRGFDERTDREIYYPSTVKAKAVKRQKEVAPEPPKPAPYVSAYADPNTGRLKYLYDLSGGTGKTYDVQRIIDALQGTSIASSDLVNDIATTERVLADIMKAGGDTSYFQGELARLKALQAAQGESVGGPLMDIVNEGLQSRVAQAFINREAENALRASEEMAARRGLSGLAPSASEANRASMGLSTAEARDRAALSAKEAATRNRMSLLNYLSGQLGQEYARSAQTAQVPLTLAGWANQRSLTEMDWANQKAIAEMAQKYAEKMQKRQLSAMRQQAEDSEDAGMWGTAGSLLGSWLGG